MVHMLLKPGLENFEHYFASMWDDCNCTVVWTFFGIVFLWDWNENWSFPVLWLLLSFQICWHIECSTFIASSFRIWNSSTGIPSPPLVLIVVMLSKVACEWHRLRGCAEETRFIFNDFSDTSDYWSEAITSIFSGMTHFPHLPKCPAPKNPHSGLRSPSLSRKLLCMPYLTFRCLFLIV